NCVIAVMMAHALALRDRPNDCPSAARGSAALRHLLSGPRRMSEPETAVAARLNDLVLLIAKNRDCRAFELLFNHFAPRIKGYLVRLGAANGAAEDLAQETMLAVWRKAHLFD